MNFFMRLHWNALRMRNRRRGFLKGLPVVTICNDKMQYRVRGVAYAESSATDNNPSRLENCLKTDFFRSQCWKKLFCESPANHQFRGDFRAPSEMGFPRNWGIAGDGKVKKRVGSRLTQHSFERCRYALLFRRRRNISPPEAHPQTNKAIEPGSGTAEILP